MSGKEEAGSQSTIELAGSLHKFSWSSKQRAKTRFKHERDLPIGLSGTDGGEYQYKTNHLFTKEQPVVWVDFNPNSLQAQ